MPAMRKLTKEAPLVIHAYQQGKDLRSVAQAFGVSAGTVRNILKRHGVPLRSRGRKRKTNDEDV